MKARVTLVISPQAYQQLHELLRETYALPMETIALIRSGIKSHMQHVVPRENKPCDGIVYHDWQYANMDFTYSIEWEKRRSWLLWSRYDIRITILRVVPIL